MQPGEFRSRSDEDVVVGRHLPPSGVHVARFMEHFEAAVKGVMVEGKAFRMSTTAEFYARDILDHPVMNAAEVRTLLKSKPEVVNYALVYAERGFRVMPIATDTTCAPMSSSARSR